MTNEPSWLEIIVGGASILSAGVAFVAAFSAEQSRRAAEQAQAKALDAWMRSAEALGERNRQVAAAARVPYANHLNEVSALIIAMRMRNVSEKEVLAAAMNETDGTHTSQLEANDPTARKFGRWVIDFSRRVPLPNGDIDAWMKATLLISTRIREWIADSAATMAAIRESPGFEPGRPIDPDDIGEWRVP